MQLDGIKWQTHTVSHAISQSRFQVPTCLLLAIIMLVLGMLPKMALRPALKASMSEVQKVTCDSADPQ